MPAVRIHTASQRQFGPRGSLLSKQKPPRAHHYVPVWLLERFCDAHGLLWWRRRDWPAGKILQSSPRSVFYENDLNTRFAADGSKDVQLENELADFDGKISSITERLTEQCRQGLLPDLDEGSLAFLYSYTFVQYKRPPELWEGSGGSHNARVDAILEPSPEVSRVLETKGLCLWSVPPVSALLVESQVVLRAGSGPPGPLEEPDHGLTFPLASDVLLGFVHGSSRREHDVLSAFEVASINRATANRCVAVAGPGRRIVHCAVT